MYFKCFTLHVMNLEYMKVSLFEISKKKKKTFSQYSIFLRCIYIYIYIYILFITAPVRGWDTLISSLWHVLEDGIYSIYTQIGIPPL